MLRNMIKIRQKVSMVRPYRCLYLNATGLTGAGTLARHSVRVMAATLEAPAPTTLEDIYTLSVAKTDEWIVLQGATQRTPSKRSRAVCPGDSADIRRSLSYFCRNKRRYDLHIKLSK
jgi:translation initiation factor 2 gamma subunit (eIF-2gamma)